MTGDLVRGTGVLLLQRYAAEGPSELVVLMHRWRSIACFISAALGGLHSASRVGWLSFSNVLINLRNPQPSPKHQTTAVNTTEFRDAPAKPEHHDGLGPARSRASAAPQKISQPMLNYTTTVAAVPLEA